MTVKHLVFLVLSLTACYAEHGLQTIAPALPAETSTNQASQSTESILFSVEGVPQIGGTLGYWYSASSNRLLRTYGDDSHESCALTDDQQNYILDVAKGIKISKRICSPPNAEAVTHKFRVVHDGKETVYINESGMCDAAQSATLATDESLAAIQSALSAFFDGRSTCHDHQDSG